MAYPTEGAPRERVSSGRRQAIEFAAVAAAVSGTAIVAAGLAHRVVGDAGPSIVFEASIALAVFAAANALAWCVLTRRLHPHGSAPREDAAGEDGASIAHDLRAPLTTITSYLELLAREGFGPMPPAAREAAQRAALASDRLHAVVESALAQRAEAAAEPLPVALADVVAGALDGLALRVAASGAAIAVAPLPVLPAREAGDATRLLRIMQNLLDNALKYQRPGEPPRIFVSATVEDGAVEIVVRDHGTGIPPHEQARVFERTARTADAAVFAEGHGLGLATVHRLAADLGARVWIDAAVTNGTAVHLALPCAAPVTRPGVTRTGAQDASPITGASASSASWGASSM